MQRSTLKILFYLKRNNPKPDGTVPLMGRITIDSTISQFSCKMTVPPKLWDTKAGRLIGNDLETTLIHCFAPVFNISNS